MLSRMRLAGYDLEDPRYRDLIGLASAQTVLGLGVSPEGVLLDRGEGGDGSAGKRLPHGRVAGVEVAGDFEVGDLSPEQLYQLKAQVMAFRYLSRGQRVPDYLAAAAGGVSEDTVTGAAAAAGAWGEGGAGGDEAGVRPVSAPVVASGVAKEGLVGVFARSRRSLLPAVV